MAKTKTLTEVASVVRHGREIVLPAEPKPMETRTAADLLYELAAQEDQTVGLAAQFTTPPYAGALALSDVLERLFGFRKNAGRRPTFVNVPVGHEQYRQAVWGAFEVPNTSIVLECNIYRTESGMVAFAVSGHCKARDQVIANELFAEVRREIKGRSIYKGKAFQIAQKGANLDLTRPDSIKFLATDATLRERLILPREVQDALEDELFTPVERYEFARDQWGVDMNRVVLLSGTYGTGKSLSGAALAAVCEENGLAFILLENVVALPAVISFCREIGLDRAVVFAEDVDRVMNGNRDGDKDTLLNLISGADKAGVELMVVLTTNDIEAIHPAMIRRFSAAIEFTLPDADCAERLVRFYGNGKVQGHLVEAPALLAGVMPALIEDTVESAKLSAIRRGDNHIIDADLVKAARKLATRQRLATREMAKPQAEQVVEQFGKLLGNGQGAALADLQNRVEEIHNQLC